MARITWQPALETGYGRIDEEHQSLVEAINRLRDAMEAGKGPDEIEDLLVFLRDYTVRHFAMEEGLMIQYNYPGTAAHFAAHSTLVLQVSDLLAAHRAGQPRPLEAVLAFLENWLLGHIQNVDRELGIFLKNREGSA
jgi:hemerythrin